MFTILSSPRKRPTTGWSLRAFFPVALLVFVLISSSCGGRQSRDVGPRGTVRFAGDPTNAIVTVDEDRIGPIHMYNQRGVLLRPGTHRIVVSAEGFFPEYRLIELKKDQVLELAFKLRAIPK